ncbi:MAG: hypothetical protein ACFB16_02085 [Phormidesmis sp.]
MTKQNPKDKTKEKPREKTEEKPAEKTKEKLKACDLCHQLVSIRYRIQYDESAKWVLVCPPCWHQVQPNNPYYRYGGTWKAKKKAKKRKT